mgnify:CR=1 FL=1
MKLNKTCLILLGILIVSFLLRLYRLDQNLPEIYADETGHYLILHEPHFFHRLYSFTWLLGVNPLGVRTAAALYSSFIPLVVFILASRLSKSRFVPLVAATLSVFLPWTFLIARIGHTHIPLLVITITFSAYFFLGKTKLGYLFSLLFLLLSAYLYPSAIIITPFVFLLTGYYTYHSLNPRQRRYSLLTICLSLLFIAALYITRYQGFNPDSRALDLAIWRDPNTTHFSDKYRALSWASEPGIFFLPSEELAAPLVYNRLTANLSIFTRNYLSFFSPDFLFLKGDPILRHSTGQFGVFYPFLLPFILYGAYRFFLTAKPKARHLFLVWILASPLPAAITKDGSGYLLRVITMLPFLTYFAALGITDSLTWFKAKGLRLVYILSLSLVGLYSAYAFFFGYFHVYPYQLETARSYEYGFKALSDFQVENDGASLLIIWDGHYPQYHFYFWQQLPESEYRELVFEDIVVGESHFYHPAPNLYFVNPYTTTDVLEFVDRYGPDYLVLPDRYFVKYPTDLVPEDEKPVKQILYPTGDVAFSIYPL